MSQWAVSDPTSSMADTLNAFTFWVGDGLYAINLDNVLSVEQDDREIQPDPFRGTGALGIVRHRGEPVRVFDFAAFLGTSSCNVQKAALIDTLMEREQDHIDWLNALETSIKTGEPFSKARSPHHCEFGRWYDRFETRDEELAELIQRFDNPHRRIHAQADRLLTMKEQGQSEQALQALSLERITTLAQLRRLFGHAREQIRDSMKSVLLFVTTDGSRPRFALRLDEINDMLSFTHDRLTATAALGIAADERLVDVVEGYLHTGGDRDCLLVNIEGLVDALVAAGDQSL